MIEESGRPRGREQFRRLAPVLVAFENLLSKLPRPFRLLLLRSFRNSDSKLARALRYLAIRTTAARCGELVDIRSQCVILEVQSLKLGSRISIHPFCYIDATGGIEIGNDVSIAHASSVLSTNHSWDDPSIPIRDQALAHKKTTIQDDVWVGAGVRIMAGVTIGRGAVVAAGAVVTSDVPAASIVGGVPARVIRSRVT